MPNEPDYSSYSLADLQDADGHLDKRAYPERAARLARELESRSAESAEAEYRKQRSNRGEYLSRTGAGYFLIVTGGMALFRLVDANDVETLSHPVVLAVMGFAGALIVAGGCLLKRWRIGLWLGLFVSVVQLPVVQVSRLQYVFSIFPFSPLRFWPPVSVSFSTGMRIDVNWSSEPLPLVLGLNLTALVVAGALALHLERLQEARRRLRGRQQTG